MREIKFRAWDKVEKAMRGVIAIDFRDGTVNLIKVFSDGKPGNYWRDLSNVVLMEYIGIKDALGKEIYEGDVIVDYYNGNFCSRIIGNKEDEMGWGLLRVDFEESEYRKLGNIFENIELDYHDDEYY